MLIKANANVNQISGGVNQISTTPLNFAIHDRNQALVQELIRAGANINRPCQCWGSPLCLAVLRGCDDTVRKLISSGADINCTDHPHLWKVLKVARHNQVLNSKVNATYTPLWLASAQGHLGIVLQLLTAGADVHISGTDTWCKEKSTPFAAAVSRMHINICVELIKAGAKPSVGWSKDVELFTACKAGDVKSVRALLSIGADVTMTSANGDTPLMAMCRLRLNTFREARIKDYTEIVLLLLCHGSRFPGPLTINWQFVPQRITNLLIGSLGCTQFQVCAMFRNHVQMRGMLKAGGVNPATVVDLVNDTTYFEVCKLTSELIDDAIKPWSPARHFLHPTAVRSSIELLLLIEVRFRTELINLTRRFAERNYSGRWKLNSKIAGSLPRLPRELWLKVFIFFDRSWYQNDGGRDLVGQRDAQSH